MKDSAHDKNHIYRVLYIALEICEDHPTANIDVIIAACLLHDIGRELQANDSNLCHAKEGSKLAYNFLIKQGWAEPKASHVAGCIKTHRFRSTEKPDSLEGEILFDADTIDSTGAIGIARTIQYNGQINDLLYSLDNNGQVKTGETDKEHSFFKEYHYKLKTLYPNLYTKKGREIAAERQKSAEDYYNAMYKEVSQAHRLGNQLLTKVLEDKQ